MKCTYVLGAGFSKAAGFPLVTEFITALQHHKTEIVRRFGAVKYKEFERVINTAPSVEDAFDRIEETAIIGDLALLKEAVAYILVACGEALLSSPTNIQLYIDFLRAVRNQNASVITLNQDTVLEIALYLDTMDDDPQRFDYTRFDYRVPGWEMHAPFKDISSPDQSPFNYFDMPYLKIHGAVNFFRCPEHRWSFRADMTNNTMPGTCPIEGKLRQCGMHVDPAIIPPRRVKDVAPFTELWDEALTELKGSDRIILIGVNLNERDNDFNGLIKNALGDGTIKMDFINYSASHTGQEYKRWINTIRDRLDYEIARNNISLDGFESWITQ